MSKNISLLNLMMTTLLWARTRRAQGSIVKTHTISPSESSPVESMTSTESLGLPARIQEQVVETVLCVENLDKLEEGQSDGVIRVDFTTGPDLEPRHYIYGPNAGPLRRILPDSASQWLSEMVNIGDAHTLSQRSIEPVQQNDNVRGPDECGPAHATELADRLVQDWTNLTINEDTMAWEAVPAPEYNWAGASKVEQLELFNLGNTTVSNPSATCPRILISTFEFTIDECNISVKHTQIGAFCRTLAHNTGFSEVTWVIPRLQGVQFPVDVAESTSFTVTVDGKEIEAKALSLRYGRIHYIIIECEDMMGDLSGDWPYPNDMETEATAIFHSFWNQCVAMTMRATSPDIYLMIESRCALAPYYLDYPTCCCIALAEVGNQGKWILLDSADDMEKWKKIFNLEHEVFSALYTEMCTSSYLDRRAWRGSVRASHMNLLRAAARYMHLHQNGFGSYILRPPVGLWGSKIAVSGNKMGKDTGQRLVTRTQRKLEQIYDLRTPPSQFIGAGGSSERDRPALKQMAQEWAGLENNSSALLFILIGALTARGGAEYLPGVIEGLLLQRSSVQFIAVGQIKDAFGEAAAYDLLRLQSRFPSRLCAKIESTKRLPKYIYTGADFAFNLQMIDPWNLYCYELARDGVILVG